MKQKHHFYPVAHTIKVMFVFYVSSIEDPIFLKLVVDKVVQHRKNILTPRQNN